MDDKYSRQSIINVNSYNINQSSNNYNDNLRFVKHELIKKNAAHLSGRELLSLQQSHFALKIEKNRINKEVVNHLAYLGSNLNNEPLQQLLSLSKFNEPILGNQQIKVIDKLISILYTSQGYPNYNLNAYEKAQIARIITDELKVHKAISYLDIIKDLATRYPEFQEIVAQETKIFPWIKDKTSNVCGLFKGLFCAWHGNIDIQELKTDILTNGFNQDFIRIHDAFSRGDFNTAKNIAESYNVSKESKGFAVGLYATIKGIYDTHIERYAQKIEPDDFVFAQSCIEGSNVARRIAPLAFNLKNEIQNNISIGTSPEKIHKLQEQLVQLDLYVKQAYNNPSFDVQMRLADHVFQVENELGVLFRPELRRSPSMERLFAPQLDFLVTSKEVGAITLAELKKFSGTIEQNILHEKMVDHFVKIESLSEKYTNKTAIEVLETYNVLIAQAHALNKDSYITLAEGAFTVAKDIVEIAVLDPPIKEIENYLVKTVTNPTDYIIKTVEGYKCVASIVLQACKHSLSGVAATPEQRLELAETSNKFIHNFFEGWQKLETSQKKEFLAEVIVDTALNKVVFSLPKLLLKMGGSSAISDIVNKGESFFNRIDPGSSGGAIAMPIAAAEHVVEVVEFAAGVVGSTAVAITSAGAQNVVVLSEMMDGGGGNDFSKQSYPDFLIQLPNEKFKAYTTVIEDGVSKIIETTFSTEEALKILNNSNELKVLNSRVDELKKLVPDTKFGVSHKRLEHSLKLFEKAINESEQFYETMRKSSGDIEKIYQNTSIPKNILQKIKNHVFIEKHILTALKNEKVIDRFASDIDIADAWKRLCNGDFVQSDLLLLQHELSESLIMQGTKIDYDIAHYKIIDLLYDWQNLL